MARKPLSTAMLAAAFEGFNKEGGDSWAFAQGVIIEMSRRIDQLEIALRFVSKRLREAGISLDPAQNGQATEVVGERPAKRLGHDGTPLDDAQAAAEAAMEAAAGPRPGEAPVPAAQQRAMPPRGGVRVPPGGQTPVVGGVRTGADGQPITDPAQLAAEEAMDAAMSD